MMPRFAAARRLGLFAGLALAMASATVQAQDTTISHGIKTFPEDPLKYPADFPHFDYVNPDAPKGGEISLSAFGTFDSMNPYTEKGLAGVLSSISVEDLMIGTADEIGALYCLICETLEYPEDKSWVIFNLRPEARFSDGSPLTAEDVVFTHELFMREGLVSYAAVTQEYIASVEALGPHQVKYTFVPESPPRDRIQIAGSSPVMSKAWFESTGYGLDESRMVPNLGSGPYLLDSFDVNQRIVYRRNPDYWGADLPINRGRHNFDRIRIEYFGDPNAAFEGFKSGAFTFRNENSSRLWATGYDFPALNAGQVVKTELPDGNMATGQSFVFNLRREKFQDPRVREAIGLMFNFEWSNQTLFYGLYERIDSFWENSGLAATGLPSPEELAILQPFADKLPPGVLDAEPVMAPTSSDRQLDRANLRRASALLDEAGWIVGADGLRRNEAGETLEIEFLDDDPTFDRVINPYVENLRALGVDARLNRVDPAQFSNRTRAFDFDIINHQIPTGFEPSAGLKQYLGSQGANDVFNMPGVSDPVVDALIEQVLAAETREELDVVVMALDRVLRAMRFWVPQWYKDVHTVAYYDYFERPENMPPYSLGQLDFWWANAEKYEALRAAGALR
jgi:microcin C transport system substrate-binding protein